MVDVSAKALTARAARAEALVLVRAPPGGGWWPRDAAAEAALVATAACAGVAAAKATAALVPMAHALALDGARVRVERPARAAGGGAVVRVEAAVATRAGTGVEMEALCAAALGALALVDMLKGALPPGALEVGRVRLLHKSGGARGDYDAQEGAGGGGSEGAGGAPGE